MQGNLASNRQQLSNHTLCIKQQYLSSCRFGFFPRAALKTAASQQVLVQAGSSQDRLDSNAATQLPQYTMVSITVRRGSIEQPAENQA
jgi:hypothetical protein